MTGDLTRKIDFRLTETEYRILRLLAMEKELSVSKFCRQIVGAVIAPTAVMIDDNTLERLESKVAAETGRQLN